MIWVLMKSTFRRLSILVASAYTIYCGLSAAGTLYGCANELLQMQSRRRMLRMDLMSFLVGIRIGCGGKYNGQMGAMQDAGSRLFMYGRNEYHGGHKEGTKVTEGCFAFIAIISAVFAILRKNISIAKGAKLTAKHAMYSSVTFVCSLCTL